MIVEAFIKIGNAGEERNTISILGMMIFDKSVEKGRRQLTYQLKFRGFGLGYRYEIGDLAVIKNESAYGMGIDET